MKIEVIFTLLIFAILLSGIYVNAAGSGSGSSGTTGSSGGSSGGSGGDKPEFSSVICDDTGTITFQMNQIDNDITAVNEENNEIIKVPGDWDINKNFKSKKKIFTNPGKYSITNIKKTKRIFTCPGLHECFFIEIKDIKCKKNNLGISSEFIVTRNIDLKDLKFNFKIGEQTLSHTSQVSNTKLKDLIIQQKNNKFILTLNKSLDISEFEVIHEKCIGKNYVYSRIECTETATSIDPESLKCGGLLEIKDRVRCRINLENEQEEYQNFFPEECRNHKDPDKCLQIYRSVSECWDLITSKKRINCLKEKINLKENEICTSIECKKELNEKILTMIKLRFYNLEEQAEILEERGLLNKEPIIDFVAEIEQKKLEFNDAKNKQEMKQIIQDVRILWKNLIKNIKQNE